MSNGMAPVAIGSLEYSGSPSPIVLDQSIHWTSTARSNASTGVTATPRVALCGWSKASSSVPPGMVVPGCIGFGRSGTVKEKSWKKLRVSYAAPRVTRFTGVYFTPSVAPAPKDVAVSWLA